MHNIDKKIQEEYDIESEKIFFEERMKMIEKANSMLNLCKDFDKNFDVQNIFIIENNKYNEVRAFYKEKGTFFHKKGGSKYLSLEFALLDYMSNIVSEAFFLLNDYCFEFGAAINYKLAQLNKIKFQNKIKNPINKLADKVTGLSESKIDLIELNYKKKIEKLNKKLDKYNQLCNKLYKFDITKDMYEVIHYSLNNFIMDVYDYETTVKWFYESIVPKLHELGFTDLIPKLENELNSLNVNNSYKNK